MTAVHATPTDNRFGGNTPRRVIMFRLTFCWRLLSSTQSSSLKGKLNIDLSFHLLEGLLCCDSETS